MAENIIIRIAAETELQNANAELQALQDREKDIRQEMIRTQGEYQKQAAQIQMTVKGREAQIAALDKLQKKHTEYQRSLDTEQKKVVTSLNDYNAKLKNINSTVADSAVKTPKLTTQIRQLKDELAKLESAGVSPTDKGFVKLAVQAAKLEDQMGDTQQRIKILASDTKNLDAAMGVGQGVAGGFTAATSAAALLGGESEQLQKAFFKVQAVMSLMNGVNQVAIALNKDSAARVVIGTAVQNNNTVSRVKNYAATKVQTATQAIETAVQGKGTIAKGAATVAQWALNAAMYAFPLVAIIAALTALTVGIVKWTKSNSEAKRVQEDFNVSLKKTKDLLDDISSKTDFWAELSKAQGKSEKEIIARQIQDAEREQSIALQNRNELQKIYSSASKKRKKALQEDYDAALELVRTSSEKVYQLNRQSIILDAQQRTDATNAAKTAQEKASDERIKEAKRLADELLKLEGLSDAVIANFKATEFEKTQAKLKESYTKQASDKAAIALFGTAVEIAQEEDYTDSINKELDKRLKAQQEHEAKKQAIIAESVALITDIGNIFFNAQSDSLQQQMSDLNHYYTTDADEAKRNADKKYISEKDLAKKQLELKQKQAKVDKAQAIFNIFMSTAQGVMAALASVPPNVPLSVLIGIGGAAQAAAVAAKPLPKYAKGKKSGGQGHFATVGELGAETMWIPDGAAVIPHNKPMNINTFSEFGIPPIAGLGDKFLRGGEIDYDKLGRAVADNVKIPQVNPLTVNVDRDGVTTTEGTLTVTHLNRKYTGRWN